MKIIIIGSVAGGTSAAAKARRNSEKDEIIVYEKDSDISYSGCGLPYYIGEGYISRGDITPRSPEWFKKRFNINIFTRHEVKSINPELKLIEVENLISNELFSESYDRLVIATGADPVLPQIDGISSENVFLLRNVRSADKIKSFITTAAPVSAVVIGGGYSGLEMTESLSKIGLDVTLVESSEHPAPAFDPDMAYYIEDRLIKSGIKIFTGETVNKIDPINKCVTTVSDKTINADIVILTAGVKPATSLAMSCGIVLGSDGGILVDEELKTNIEDIYAVGDCCEIKSSITGDNIYRPLGSTANKMGRAAGDSITGGDLQFRGAAGTGIFSIFGLAAAHTGLSEKEALEKGYKISVSHNIKENRSKYLKGAGEIVIKTVAETENGRILGAQIIGEEGVDKRIDVFVTAMAFGATVSDLMHLDLAYAPPFSTTKDPVIYSGMILTNALFRGRPLVTATELIRNREKYLVIDVRSREDFDKGHIPGAINISHENLRKSLVEIPRDKKIVVHCNKGTTGNAAQNLLINSGFDHVYNLSGGYSQYVMETKIRH